MHTYNVRSCSERLAPYIIRTPLVEVEELNRRLGKRVFLKLESLQRTGAFKFRGAMNYMLSLGEEEAARGIITASSGNHGLGMSLAGQLRGVKCAVVMPVTAPQTKQRRAKAYGASLILHGADYDEAQVYAKSLAAQEGYIYVPSFNHPRIIEGQGTMLSEILEDRPSVDTVIAPVGGGGVLAGLLVARKEMGANHLRLVGVEAAGAASMQAALRDGCPSTIPNMKTIADGVAVRTVGDLNLEIIKELCPTLWQVDDEIILDAQRLLFQESRIISETAGAVSVAGLLEMGLPEDAREVVCIISGSNVDLPSLTNLAAANPPLSS